MDLSQREAELAIATQDIVVKALSTDSTFRKGDARKLKTWVYDFPKRRNLSMRTWKRKSQIKDSEMQSVKVSIVVMSWLLPKFDW